MSTQTENNEHGLTVEQVIEKRRKMYEMDLFFFGKQISEQKDIMHEADQKQKQLRAQFLKMYASYQIGNRIDYEFSLTVGGNILKQREVIVVTEVQFTRNTQTMEYDILYIGKRTNKDGFTINKKTSFEKKVWHSWLSKPNVTVYHRQENKKDNTLN